MLVQLALIVVLIAGNIGAMAACLLWAAWSCGASVGEKNQLTFEASMVLTTG